MPLPEDADMDFTASVFIIEDGRVLMLKHTKLDAWLQPGGHIDPGETPDETARREAREETGMHVELVPAHHPPEPGERAEELPQPFTVNLHPIREGHWHCDFGFLARLVEEGEATHADEHEGVRWFDRAALHGEEDMPENVRRAALRALEEAA